MGLFVSTSSAQQFEEMAQRALPGVTTTSGSPEVNWILEVNGGGVVLGDFDGKGNLDLVVVDGSTPERVQAGKPGEAPRLLLSQGDGSFTPAGEDWTMAGGRWGMGGVAGDLDGDGALDLVVTEWGPDRVFLGGDGFQEVTAGAGLVGSYWGSSAALLDADADGILDLVVVNYLDFDFEHVPSRTSGDCTWKGRPVNCGPEGLDAQADQIYRGKGDGTFESFGAGIGFVPRASGFGLGVVTGDFDADGDMDLYITNDSTPNHLWENVPAESGRSFQDKAMRRGVAVDANGREQAGMGVGAGDVDGDGRADFFVTNFSGENHCLYLSANRKSYRERSHMTGVAGASTPLLGWGAGLADLDNDADLDLFAFHGHVYPQADRTGTDTTYGQVDYLMRNTGTLTEPRFAPEPLTARAPSVSRAATVGDLDGDGDLDLVAVDRGGPVRVLRNDLKTGENSWFGVRLLDKTCANTMGVGARIELDFAVKAGDGGEDSTLTLRREITVSGGFQAGLPGEAHFGLGDLGAPIAGRIYWPSGDREAQVVPDSILKSVGGWHQIVRDTK